MRRSEAGATLAILLALMLPVAAWRAYVAGFLWSWFATPAFGLAVPGLWTLVGLMLLAGLLWPRSAKSEAHEGWADAFGTAVGYGFVAPALTLGFGWVLAFFGGLL